MNEGDYILLLAWVSLGLGLVCLAVAIFIDKEVW